jgi:arylsulfatase A-like enzyme
VPRADRKEPFKRYRGAVTLVDAALGDLVAGLRERGRWDDAIVILLSDHGESLGEHERLPENHGLVLYNALVHVPLWIRVPGVTPVAVHEPVSLIDVMPTLLELAGGEPVPSEGTSLAPLLVNPAAKIGPRPLPLNESQQRGVIMWPYKLLRRLDADAVEVYDLEQDFGESNDLHGRDEKRDAELARALASLPRPDLDRTAAGRRERERTAEAGSTDTD